MNIKEIDLDNNVEAPEDHLFEEEKLDVVTDSSDILRMFNDEKLDISIDKSATK